MCIKEIEVLTQLAEKAGIPVPEQPEQEKYNTYDFAHWVVLCIIQPPLPLLNWEDALQNAKVLSSVPKNKLIHMKWDEFEELGMTI